MAETRLSKLQKWIIDGCLENAKKDMERDGKKKGMGYLFRQEIYLDFFKLPLHKYGTWPKSKIVTVSRSLKNLEEKGFITVPSHLRPKGCMILLSDEYMRFLNKIAKERKALMLTKQVNNKKIKGGKNGRHRGNSVASGLQRSKRLEL